MRGYAPRALVAATLFATVGGCSDPVTPAASRAPGDAPQALVNGVVMLVVQRTVALTQNYAASATIGTAGGTIRIPQAGFTITFPAGAVSAPVTVRATALAGKNVAYRFEPHGIVFQKEPVIAQDLSLTGVAGQLLTAGLAGGYIPKESTLAGGGAVVTEARPASVDLLRVEMTFTIRHFSAYAATRKGGYLTSSGTRMTGGAPVQ